MANEALKHNFFYRKSAKRWVFAYVPPGGDWKRPTQVTAPKEVQSERNAKAWVAVQLETLAKSGGVLPSPTRGPAFAEISKRAFEKREMHPRIKKSTISNYKTHLKTWINPKLGVLPFSSIDTGIAAKFVREVRDADGVSANHCRNIFSTARMVWDVARGENWTKVTNPFRDKYVIDELPKARTKAGEVIAITPEHVQLLVHGVAVSEGPGDRTARPPVPLERRVRYALAITSSAGDGELAGLRWCDVHLEAEWPHITIVQALSLHGPGGYATPDAPKTDNRKRVIALHPAAAEALGEWKREGWPMLVRKKPRDVDYVFVKDNGKPWRPKSAAKLRADLELVGAPSTVNGHDVTFHALRRTFSTVLEAEGVSTEMRGRIMGHRAETVTEGSYTAANLSSMAAAVAKFPLVWKSVRKSVCTEKAPAQTNGGTQGENREPLSRLELETYGLRSESRAVSGRDTDYGSTAKRRVANQASNGSDSSNGQASTLVSAPRTDGYLGTPLAWSEPGSYRFVDGVKTAVAP